MKQQKFSLGRIIIFGHLVDNLRSFYVDYFNFEVVEEIKDQWIVLKAGQTELAIHKIGQEYQPKDGIKFKAESNTKLVFQTSENISNLRQQLINAGAVIGDIKSFKGNQSLFFDGEDPEGNIFQIEQKA